MDLVRSGSSVLQCLYQSVKWGANRQTPCYTKYPTFNFAERNCAMLPTSWVFIVFVVLIVKKFQWLRVNCGRLTGGQESGPSLQTKIKVWGSHTCSGRDLVYFEDDDVLARQYKSAALESQKLGSNGSCQLHFVQSHPQPSHFPDDLVAEKRFYQRAN